jgi:ribonuclease-3
MKIYENFEKAFGIKFKNPDLLKEALTHRSYLNESPGWVARNNERLEYLGDAVLELIVTEFLFGKFPNEQEGRLTSLRAALVNYVMLARVAKEISLAENILLSRGEAKDTGRSREVIAANAFEALVGAIYLDRGLATAEKFVKKAVLVHLDEVLEKRLYRDPKSELQEIIQEKLKITPTYRVLSETGPDHLKNFSIGVYFKNEKFEEGTGSSKQEAESRAALAALKKLAKRDA